MKILKRLVFLFLAATLISANTFPMKRAVHPISIVNSLPKIPTSALRITDAHLSQPTFDSILKNTLARGYVELDLSGTKITHDQLASILNQIGGNLRKLSFHGCHYLYDFEAIRNCINLQELDLSSTNIDNKQLANILNQIGRNLRTLSLNYCHNLYNFEAIRNCTQLQELNLSVTNITGGQLADILNQIGINLKMLSLWNCNHLYNFEAIRNCTQLQELDLSWSNIYSKQLIGILNQMGGNLKTLDLRSCKNLPYLFEKISDWAQERNIELYLG